MLQYFIIISTFINVKLFVKFFFNSYPRGLAEAIKDKD